MTQTAVTTSVVLANTLAVVCMATSELNPLLEYVQNGASVAAVMGIFLWREMKRAERYEKLTTRSAGNALPLKGNVPPACS